MKQDIVTSTQAHILLVDDRLENLLVLEEVLKDIDCRILKAQSGQEALRQVLKHDLALVFLDVQMPGMDGFEVAELMRRKQRAQQVPIIFLTAINKEQQAVFKGYKSGAVDYLFKPSEPEILKSKAQVFID